jgi:hypothetical protein
MGGRTLGAGESYIRQVDSGILTEYVFHCSCRDYSSSCRIQRKDTLIAIEELLKYTLRR